MGKRNPGVVLGNPEPLSSRVRQRLRDETLRQRVGRHPRVRCVFEYQMTLAIDAQT